jgi:hypothetical protein
LFFDGTNKTQRGTKTKKADVTGRQLDQEFFPEPVNPVATPLTLRCRRGKPRQPLFARTLASNRLIRLVGRYVAIVSTLATIRSWGSHLKIEIEQVAVNLHKFVFECMGGGGHSAYLLL